MMDLIVQAPNEKGEAIYAAEWKAIDSVELMAWIGLHLRSGVDKDAFKPIAELFSSKTGPPIYRASMSRERFKQMKRCIRFDKTSTREMRRNDEQGKLAPVNEIWHRFIEACQKSYKAGSCVTIDESLVPFRGRCSFEVYVPSKPSKYGIKIWCMVDASNAYLLNAQIYSGKKP